MKVFLERPKQKKKFSKYLIHAIKELNGVLKKFRDV